MESTATFTGGQSAGAFCGGIFFMGVRELENDNVGEMR
jgi:hypothetical protein